MAVKLNFVDRGAEPVIVRTQCVEYRPDYGKTLVVVDFFRRDIGGNEHRNDDMANFLPGAVRMTRPTDCTTSIWELRAERKRTASSEGTSTPSERQRTLVRMRHSLPSEGEALSHAQLSSLVVALMVPSMFGGNAHHFLSLFLRQTVVIVVLEAGEDRTDFLRRPDVLTKRHSLAHGRGIEFQKAPRQQASVWRAR